MNYIIDHIPRSTPHECEWKDVKGFEGHYRVSCCGKVKSLERTVVMKNGVPRHIKEKIIPWKMKDNGYCFVKLHIGGKYKNKYIHRLVAEHFIPNNKGLPEINHKDGNKQNNRISNLEWVTHSANLIHAYENKLKKTGEEHQQSKLTNADVLFIRQNYKPGHSVFGAKPLAERFGVSKPTISTIARNIKRKHG